MLGLQHDVTEQVAREQQLHSLAYRDALTGLPNRHQLDEHLTLALARAGRTGDTVALLYLDLDGFKQVNDRHGHAAGDLLLRQVAERLQAAVRRTDLVCRHGGDEFLVLLGDLARPSARHAAAVTAAQIRKCLRQPFLLTSGEVRVQVSIGTALYPDDTTDPQHLIHLADQDMYKGKPRPG